MVQLLLVIGIGYQFYDLASKNNRNKWLFGILAAVLFFALQFVLGFLLMIGLYALNLLQTPNFVISIGSIAISFVVVYIIYTRIKREWEQEKKL